MEQGYDALFFQVTPFNYEICFFCRNYVPHENSIYLSKKCANS